MARTTTKGRARAKTTPAQMADPSTAGKELATVGPGAEPGADPNAAAKQPERVSATKMRAAELLDLIERKHRDDIQGVLNAYNISFDFFKAAIRQALLGQAKMLECTPKSFLEAAMRAARDGLLPDGREAAIVPFWDKDKKSFVASYIPMYQGMLKVGYKATIRDCEIEVIFEGEEQYLDFQRGDDGYIHFRPKLNRPVKANIIGAYAIIRTIDGGVFRDIMGQQELEKVGAISKARSGPAKNWPEAMAKKSPLRRLFKIIPRDARMESVLAHDEDAYISPPADTAEEKARDIPNSQLFSDQAHKPAEGPAAEALALEEPKDPSLSDEDFAKLLGSITGASEGSELGLIEDDMVRGPIAAELSPAQREEAGAAIKRRLQQIQAGSQLLITTANGETKERESAAAWMGDMLNWMSTYSGQRLKQFWAANEGHVQAVHDFGGDGKEQAARILRVAKEKGLIGG